MSQLIINPFRFGVVAPEFASLYESFDPLTVIRKQHFVEWFSGKALDSIWTTHVVVAGSGVMVDAINGGYELECVGVNANFNIDFNSISHYDLANACVCIAVCKRQTTGTNHNAIIGFKEVFNGSGDDMVFRNATQVSFTQLQNDDGTGVSNVDTTTAVHTNETVIKLIRSGSKTELFEEGILKATNTSKVPNGPSQPSVHIFGASGTAQFRVRFYEAFNT